MKIQTCKGVPGACSPGKILEFLDCLRLHFARFHGGERDRRVVKRKSQSQALDLLQIQQNNGCMVSQFLSNGRPSKIQLRHTKVLVG